VVGNTFEKRKLKARGEEVKIILTSMNISIHPQEGSTEGGTSIDFKLLLIKKLHFYIKI
jgi:hypothetical protein